MRFTNDVAAAQAYWGLSPLPKGAATIGLIEREGVSGALIRFPTGIFAQGISGSVRTLSQSEVKAVLGTGITYATYDSQSVAVVGDIIPGGLCLTDIGTVPADLLSNY